MRCVALISLSLISLLTLSSPAMATKIGYQFGLSMHDTPLEEGDNDVFNYANAGAQKGGTLRQSVPGTFDTLNPYTLKGTAAQGLQYVYDRLMARSWDEPFTLYPQIASEVRIAPDRSWISFTLDPHAQFHDLSPITADDVAFTFQTLKEHGRPNMRRVYQMVEKIEQPTSREITFRLGKGYDRETVMIIAMMPVLSKAWWGKRDFETALQDIPLGSGPYKIKSFEPGRRIVYERVSTYWAQNKLVAKGLNNFQTLIFDYFRDDGVALESFIKGDIDIRRETDPNRWEMAYKNVRGIRQVEFAHHRAENIWGIMLNMRRKPFDDIRVRQAVSIVLDANRLNETLLRGRYERARSIYPNTALEANGVANTNEAAYFKALSADLKTGLPADMMSNAWLPPRDDSPSILRARQIRAGKLLDEAGYVVKNGKRINPATGQPLSFEVITNMPADEKIVLSWQKQLAKLGIALRVRSLDGTSFRNRMLDYDYDAMVHSWPSTMSPGTEQTLYWGCQAASEKGRFNFTGFCHPLADKLAASMPQTTKREDLTTLARLLDRLVMSSYAFVPLFYNPKDYYAIRDAIAYPQPSLYGPVIESWWIDNPQRILRK